MAFSHYKSTVAILFGSILIFSCVPARKFEELKSKQQACYEENKMLKSLNQELEEKNKELTAAVADLTKRKEALLRDTTLLGMSLRKMTANYDRINDTYELLLAKNKELTAGNKSATDKLMKQLQASQENLQQQEDALRSLDISLKKKEADLEQLNAELQNREKRVKELEALIRSKDEAVSALKMKLKEALLGFENNGLTIEQKNGKVYVSLDESLLFASGSYAVGAEGINVLKKLAQVLEQNPEINVLVEGHTDNVPFKGKGDIKDNWDLSVKRSTSVVKIITSNSNVAPKRLTAAGRGEYVPLDLSNTPAALKKNRRIEVILTPKLDELFQLLENE